MAILGDACPVIYLFARRILHMKGIMLSTKLLNNVQSTYAMALLLDVCPLIYVLVFLYACVCNKSCMSKKIQCNVCRSSPSWRVYITVICVCWFPYDNYSVSIVRWIFSWRCSNAILVHDMCANARELKKFLRNMCDGSPGGRTLSAGLPVGP